MNDTRHNTMVWRKVNFLTTGAMCLMAMGCESNSNSPFDRFESLPSVEELVTVSLGEYVIPVPVQVDEKHRTGQTARQVQIEFELHAAVLPRYERNVTASFRRLEGRFRDRVIDVCRHTPMADLIDPGLTTLKAHLTDSLKPLLGDARIERVHIADSQLKRL